MSERRQTKKYYMINFNLMLQKLQAYYVCDRKVGGRWRGRTERREGLERDVQRC